MRYKHECTKPAAGTAGSKCDRSSGAAFLSAPILHQVTLNVNHILTYGVTGYLWVV
jgi:hypothetical protein